MKQLLILQLLRATYTTCLYQVKKDKVHPINFKTLGL